MAMDRVLHREHPEVMQFSQGLWLEARAGGQRMGGRQQSIAARLTHSA